MKVLLDRETDALYIRLTEIPIVESEEVQPGVILDFNAEGIVVGIEMLDVSKRMSPDEIENFQVVTA